MGPENILLGNWYRPGATEHDGYTALQEEMHKFLPEITGIILTGDLNIHHARWLRYSNGNSTQGADLKVLCDNFGLQQLTREPTRQQYLLDLYLTDVACTKVQVGPYVADHKFLLAKVAMPETKKVQVVRHSFNLQKADWSGLNAALERTDWSPLKRGCAEDAITYFMEILWATLCTHIPYEEVVITKKSHPWLNARCETAVREKNAAEGTDHFDEKRTHCSQVIAEEYQK